MVPKITVCTTTLRKDPRFKETADSLFAAIKPPIEWEWLVVDGYLWYDPHRKALLEDAVERRFPFRHVEPKPSLWQGPHRITSKDYWDACSARNTAFITARHPYVVFIDDCMEVEMDWFFQILRGINSAYAGTYISVDKDKKPIPGSEDHRPSMCPEAQYVAGGWLYGMNMGVPLAEALKVDGYDEMYSGQGGVEDCDFGVRLERAGCKVLWNPDSVVRQLTETHEAICGYGGQSTFVGKASPSKPKERVLKNGQTRFANEYLIERLFDDPKRSLPLLVRGLYGLREMYWRGEPLPIPKGPRIDWRDGQKLEDM